MSNKYLLMKATNPFLYLNYLDDYNLIINRVNSTKRIRFSNNYSNVGITNSHSNSRSLDHRTHDNLPYSASVTPIGSVRIQLDVEDDDVTADDVNHEALEGNSNNVGKNIVYSKRDPIYDDDD
jgi:tRNA G26 N,N-dimethylase Trm1